MRREPAVPPWRGANLHEDDNGNFKDGAFTAEAIEERQWLRSLALSFSGLDPEADMPGVCDGCGNLTIRALSGKLSLRYPIRRGDVSAWFRLSVGG